MRQVSIRYKEIPDGNYPWSSIEEFDELAGVYYRATVLFPGKSNFERIYDVVYSEKLESFLLESPYKEYIEEYYYKDEGFDLPDRNTAQKLNVKMDDLEDLESGLKDAISKLKE